MVKSLSGTLWMLQCYLKTGIIRRNSIITILWFITISLVIYGVLVIAQKQTGAKGAYWNFPLYPDFIGSIPYRNRAASILYLGMTLTMALYFLHLKSMRMELRHSGPHLVVMLATVFIYGLLWSTQSQMGLIVGSSLLALFLLFTFIPSLRDGTTLMHKLILSAIMAIFAVMSFFYTQRVPDSDLTIEKMGNLREEIRNLDSQARTLTTKISMDMFDHRWLMGWGGGSWRYVFPYYQRQYPEIMWIDDTKTELAYWEDAHNDWAQYLSELGVIGFVLLLSLFMWPIVESISVIRTIHLSQVILCFGLIGVFSHAVMDLLLQNQSVLCFIAFMSYLINRLNVDQIRYK